MDGYPDDQLAHPQGRVDPQADVCDGSDPPIGLQDRISVHGDVPYCTSARICSMARM